MNATQTQNLGTCCHSGCSKPATRRSAPTVFYCLEHSLHDLDATRRDVEQSALKQAEAGIRADAAEQRRASYRIEGNEAVNPETGERRQIVRHWHRDIAIADARYIETSYGEVDFVSPGDARYTEFAAVAQGEWPELA